MIDTRRFLLNRPALICVLAVQFIFNLQPAAAHGGVLTADTAWSGAISVGEDILVPEGVTLTIAAGTIVRVSASESTKTDPEYLSPLTEITVRGTLVVDGKPGSPVSFLLLGDKKAAWAGIIIDRGKAVIRSAVINNAETGVYVINGSLSLVDSLIEKNRYGLTVQGTESKVRVRNSRIQENDYGVFLLNGAALNSTESVISRNRKKDRYFSVENEAPPMEKEDTDRARTNGKSRVYGDDEALLGTTIWQGRVEVGGIIRVPEKSRLIVLPGTVVEFRKKNTNHDTIGENGILVQGVIIAKGTRENPIIFRSAERTRNRGDWDSINIMNSDNTQNLLEYCRIEDAYRGLHFHFSHVAVIDSVLRNNYRGIQFQESVVEIRGTRCSGNISGIQARDSEIVFVHNIVSHNYVGMNIFRNSIQVRDSSFRDNYFEGLRVREGLPVIDGNLVDGNRHGITVTDCQYGTFSRNVVAHNRETGISLKNTDAIEISGNVVQSNGVNGINIQDSAAAVRGNLITDNGERGIGILSFQGNIVGNTITGNKLYNLGIDGTMDVLARGNWWGAGDVKKTMYDKENDPSKGRLDYLPALGRPEAFSWPLSRIRTDTVWRGVLRLEESVTVEQGSSLLIAPDTSVHFSKGAGLAVRGRIRAEGEKQAFITFTASPEKGASDWDEILLDHATGSAFTYCSFSRATWALHSHFTDLKVDDCSFTNNNGGIRFTSGPLEIRRSLFAGNDIAIRAFRGSALITGNVISGNRVGIFVREKGGGLTVTGNNLFANTNYNIRMGDFNDEDVNAKNNWWGVAPPAAASLYDARTEPGIGMVLFEPYAEKPLELEAPSGTVPKGGQ